MHVLTNLMVGILSQCVCVSHYFMYTRVCIYLLLFNYQLYLSKPEKEMMSRVYRFILEKKLNRIFNQHLIGEI